MKNFEKIDIQEIEKYFKEVSILEEDLENNLKLFRGYSEIKNEVIYFVHVKNTYYQISTHNVFDVLEEFFSILKES